MGFSRQEYWTQGSNLCVLCLLHWQVDSLPPTPPRWLYFPGSSDSEESACNAGHQGLIPGSGRFPGEGNGSPLQHSCLENSMHRPLGRKELDMTEQLTLTLNLFLPEHQLGSFTITVKVKSVGHSQHPHPILCDYMDCCLPGSLSLEFSRQGY